MSFGLIKGSNVSTKALGFLALIVVVLLSGCETTRVEPTRIEDRSASFYNASASIDLVNKRRSRLYLDLEYNEASGSDSETRTFTFNDVDGSDESIEDEVSAQHDLTVQSYRVSFGINAINRERVSLSVSPGVQLTRLERITEVDGFDLPEVQHNTWLGVKLSLASKLNDYVTVKGFGSVHLKSQEAGLLFAFHPVDWLDLELGWRVLDYDEALFDNDERIAYCPQEERIDRVRCAYDQAEIEAVFNGFSGGLHFKF